MSYCSKSILVLGCCLENQDFNEPKAAMPKLHELDDGAFLKAQQQRRKLADELEADGYTSWDMTPEGHERYQGRELNDMKVIRFDSVTGEYVAARWQ